VTDKRIVIHAAFVLLLPLIVAAFGLSVWSALGLVILGLLWRWAIVMLGWRTQHKGPDLVLETIPPSHYVEKVRWCMDRLGVDYEERQWGGTIGAFYLGRTVPRLHVRTGAVWSQIGNSAEILRFLWGTHVATTPAQASFLEPTGERLEFEAAIDRCGRSLQVWVYYHLQDHADLLRHVWGAENPDVPWWQRQWLRLLTPLQAALIRNAFQTTEAHSRKSRARIEELLDNVETKLADGRETILGGSGINYTDITFAAIMGLALRPDGYGGGAADSSWLEEDDLPADMRDDIERWRHDYPRTTGFVTGLYERERGISG
jgi:glutathione S-transferase